MNKKYFPDLIFGGIDGVITTFAIIAGVVGASLSPFVIFILGLANLFADGFSMGVSNYISTKSENQINKTSSKKPVHASLTTFFAFLFFGSLPLLPYIIFQFSSLSFNTFLISSVAAFLTFVLLGYMKYKATNKSLVKSLIETVLVGVAASMIAYFVGDFLSGLIY